MFRRGGRAFRRAVLLAAVLTLPACGVRDLPAAPHLRASAEALRGLEFASPVRVTAVERGQLAALLLSELGPLAEPRVARRVRDAYAALGALPPDLDFVAAFLELHVGRLAGLYSPRRRQLFMVGPPERWHDEVVVHELVHALQHLHFPRAIELLQRLRHNDDLAAALAAAAEGDATLTMLRSAGDPSSPVPPARVEAYRSALRSAVELPSGGFATVPPPVPRNTGVFVRRGPGSGGSPLPRGGHVRPRRTAERASAVHPGAAGTRRGCARGVRGVAARVAEAAARRRLPGRTSQRRGPAGAAQPAGRPRAVPSPVWRLPGVGTVSSIWTAAGVGSCSG